MTNSEKELQVSAIENGTAIDHIPADKLFDVINVLGLNKQSSNTMTFGTNLKSEKLGRKAIIKIWDKFLESDEINRLAVIVPNVRINIIRNYKVVEKKQVHMPENVEGLVKCMNPKCITNHQDIKTKFSVVSESPIVLRCHYCEKLTDEKNIIIL